MFTIGKDGRWIHSQLLWTTYFPSNFSPFCINPFFKKNPVPSAHSKEAGSGKELVGRMALRGECLKHFRLETLVPIWVPHPASVETHTHAHSCAHSCSAMRWTWGLWWNGEEIQLLGWEKNVRRGITFMQIVMFPNRVPQWIIEVFDGGTMVMCNNIAHVVWWRTNNYNCSKGTPQYKFSQVVVHVVVDAAPLLCQCQWQPQVGKFFLNFLKSTRRAELQGAPGTKHTQNSVGQFCDTSGNLAWHS